MVFKNEWTTFWSAAQEPSITDDVAVSWKDEKEHDVNLHLKIAQQEGTVFNLYKCNIKKQCSGVPESQ